MEGGFNACGPNFNRAISGSMPRNDEIVPAKKNRKELRALAAGLPTIFQDRRCELPALPPRDHVGDEAGLHGWTGRRVVEGSTSYGGPLRITEWGVTRNGTSKTRAKKMHGLMHVSGTLALDSREKPGGVRGGPSF
jgi:hypothetical protein